MRSKGRSKRIKSKNRSKECLDVKIKYAVTKSIPGEKYDDGSEERKANAEIQSTGSSSNEAEMEPSVETLYQRAEHELEYTIQNDAENTLFKKICQSDHDPCFMLLIPKTLHLQSGHIAHT